MLRRRLAASIGALGLLGVIAALVELKALPNVGDERLDQLSSLGGPLVPVVIGIVAVLLANWFQQRAAFVESLRRLWSHVIEARIATNDYLLRPGADSRDYWSAWQKLSRAIDETRGVYRNVGETEEKRGFFPFEQMHDMRRAFENLGADDRSEHRIRQARSAMDGAWNSLRAKFLDEFETPEPTNPTTRRGTRDERLESDGPTVH